MEHIAVGVVERGHCRERERIRSTAMYEPLRIATGVGGALVVKITFRFMPPLATNPPATIGSGCNKRRPCTAIGGDSDSYADGSLAASVTWHVGTTGYAIPTRRRMSHRVVHKATCHGNDSLETLPSNVAPAHSLLQSLERLYFVLNAQTSLRTRGCVH
jgi:hypothetical protein